MKDDHDLMMELRAIEHVVSVELHWSPALTVKIRLDAMDWAARRAVMDVVGFYLDGREQEWLSGADVVFDIPEPLDFTRGRINRLRVAR